VSEPRPETTRPTNAFDARAAARLLLALALPLGVGGASGAVTRDAIGGWYATLAKPSFQPPSWVFGPVWSVLYVLMGVALFLVWRADRHGRDRAVALWATQLALNAAWSLIFFGRRAIGPALAEILVLWVAVAATVVAFHRQDRTAGRLLVPYLGWVSFATLLNASIWRLNERA